MGLECASLWYGLSPRQDLRGCNNHDDFLNKQMLLRGTLMEKFQEQPSPVLRTNAKKERKRSFEARRDLH